MSFKIHNETQVHDLLACDATRRDGSRMIWIGYDDINGQWLTALEALEVAAAIAKIAIAHIENSGPEQQGGAA